ncbi:MAG: hypothetical protein ACREK8_08800 [Gemmatimonadales bacterium]
MPRRPIILRLVHAAILLTMPIALTRTASAQRALDTVFIVPGSHLDLGYTAPVTAVREQRIQNLDRVIELAEHDRSFVWFEEGGWAVEAWLDHYHDRPSQVARLRALVMRGQIGVGATLLSPYAAAFPDALRLLTLHLDRITRELGRRPTVAVVNDVPAVPEAMVDALAAAGIHYLLMGPNLMYSPPLPATVTRAPFYWVTSSGARVLVAIDPEGYQAGLNRWFLPPECLRSIDAREFGGLSDDSILNLGVATQLARQGRGLPLSIVQHSLDNSGPECVASLGAAVARWNARPHVARLIVSTPDVFFHHVEARFGSTLAVRRGEWGGIWDLLRASEPVWSWRLRRAIHAISATTSRDLRLAAVEVTDHNMGLGPRWLDGLPAEVARQHVAGVADSYRRLVEGVLGRAALSSIPPPIPAPAGNSWPSAWRTLLGDRAHAAVVRAGLAFLYPFVSDSAPAAPVPITASADAQRLVIHATIDRVRLEQRLGPRYQAVIEVTLRAPIAAIRIAPATSADGRAGRWLLGTPMEPIITPDGVRVTGPGWSLTGHGPLLLAWALRPDPGNPAWTKLQALAVVHSVDGIVDGGARVRFPFSMMYPGEPAVPVFDLELTLSH